MSVLISPTSCLFFKSVSDSIIKHSSFCENDECHDKFRSTDRFVFRDGLFYEYVCVDDYFCDTCVRMQNTFEDYKKHIDGKRHSKRQIKPNEVYICELCKAPCTSYMTLQDHLSSHSEKLLKCTECNKNFSSPVALQQHISSASHKLGGKNDDKEYTCETCLLKIIGSIGYTEHLKSHDKVIFECVVCNKSFLSRESLLQHNGTVAHAMYVRMKNAST